MYICRIVLTLDVKECTFCVNEQQKVFNEQGLLSARELKILVDC